MCAQSTFATKLEIGRETAKLVSTQYGLITRDQARSIGLSDSAIKSFLATGRWERVHRGVYRLAGFPRSWEQSLTAAVLLAGNGACASHRAAGALWRLEGVEYDLVEISSTGKLRVPDNGMIVHRVTQLPKADITVVRSIPATEPSRTLLDFAAVVSPETLEMALEDAWRRGLVSLARLRWRLAGTRSKGRKGASALRRLLLERPAGTVPTDSALEFRFLQVARKGGLVPSERQYEIRNNGKLISRVDFAYVASKLAIEVDGFKWHSGRASWERDLSRGNTVGALGWRVLHATSRMLDSPDELLQTIRDYLGK